MEALKRLRAVGSLRMGWESNDMEPPTANALVKAGLAEIRTTGGSCFQNPNRGES